MIVQAEFDAFTKIDYVKEQPMLLRSKTGHHGKIEPTKGPSAEWKRRESAHAVGLRRNDLKIAG